MKTLLLLRHASAAPSHAGGDDRERPLDERGRAEARRMASSLEAVTPAPTLVLCSPARRAVETLDAVRAGLPRPARISLEPLLYLASPGELLGRLQDLEDAAESALVVGHNPGLAALARGLAAGGDASALGRLRRYPPAALAQLRFEATRWRDLVPGGGQLVAFATP